jgi:5-methylcytosine-specific restriction enzyme A
MTYWILQANPRRYRFFDALRDGYEITSWSVAHLQNEIAPGDEFALWVSGEARGVYALGVVTEPAEYRQDDDPYWTDPADATTPGWEVGIRIREAFVDSPILADDLARDPRFADALILRMPGGRNPFRLTEDQWQVILSRRPSNTTGTGRPGRNPPWSRDERLLALDLYLRRRPQLPGAEDREVQDLSAFLNSLPIHTVRPDLETFRNPNDVSLKLANFAALDPQYPRAGMRSVGRADAEVWDRYSSRPDELRQVVQAIRAAAAGSVLPNVPEPDEDELEADEGRLLTRLHRVRERNPALVRRKKEVAYRAGGALPCEVCGFDFARTYGDLGDRFIEAHHVLPLAAAGIATTRLTDLALVCSNCHRMLHRAKPWITPDELRARLNVSLSVQGQLEVRGPHLTTEGSHSEPRGVVVRRCCCHRCCQRPSDLPFGGLGRTVPVFMRGCC